MLLVEMRLLSLLRSEPLVVLLFRHQQMVQLVKVRFSFRKIITLAPVEISDSRNDSLCTASIRRSKRPLNLAIAAVIAPVCLLTAAASPLSGVERHLREQLRRPPNLSFEQGNHVEKDRGNGRLGALKDRHHVDQAHRAHKTAKHERQRIQTGGAIALLRDDHLGKSELRVQLNDASKIEAERLHRRRVRVGRQVEGHPPPVARDGASPTQVPPPRGGTGTAAAPAAISSSRCSAAAASSPRIPSPSRPWRLVCGGGVAPSVWFSSFSSSLDFLMSSRRTSRS
jgi:hypothetical protein